MASLLLSAPKTHEVDCTMQDVPINAAGVVLPVVAAPAKSLSMSQATRKQHLLCKQSHHPRRMMRPWNPVSPFPALLATAVPSLKPNSFYLRAVLRPVVVGTSSP